MIVTINEAITAHSSFPWNLEVHIYTPYIAGCFYSGAGQQRVVVKESTASVVFFKNYF